MQLFIGKNCNNLCLKLSLLAPQSALRLQTNAALINFKLNCFNLRCQYVIYKQCNLNMKSVNKSLLNRIGHCPNYYTELIALPHN